MAGLPPDGEWLVQQNEGIVSVFRQGSEETVVSFDPSDGFAAARAQKEIHNSDLLTPEQKAFAHFWSGYFYAHASGGISL